MSSSDEDHHGGGQGLGADLPPDLLTSVYEELHALARSYLRKERANHTLQTTALVHEAWLRLAGRDEETFSNRSHYFRAAALMMRRLLVDHAQKTNAEKRGSGRRGQALEDALVPGEAATGVDVLSLHEALERLAQDHPRKAQVVELRYFGGCTIDEAALALGIGTATVEREWRFARAWLRFALEGSTREPGSES